MCTGQHSILSAHLIQGLQCLHLLKRRKIMAAKQYQPRRAVRVSSGGERVSIMKEKSPGGSSTSHRAQLVTWAPPPGRAGAGRGGGDVCRYGAPPGTQLSPSLSLSGYPHTLPVPHPQAALTMVQIEAILRTVISTSIRPPPPSP